VTSGHQDIAGLSDDQGDLGDVGDRSRHSGVDPRGKQAAHPDGEHLAPRGAESAWSS
jgi:hypothetical protein